MIRRMFGGFPKKLKTWVDAGLITQDQSAQILEHEKNRKSGKLGRDLTNVGLFAILLGVASIVASNWQIIPPFGKLALHTVLNLGVVAAILRFDPVQHPFKRDSCVMALFALFLTFIALIAQIYQLHGELYQTLIFWLAICTPFIWYWGKTYVAALPWLTASLVTLFITALEFINFNNAWLWITLLTGIYLPLALLVAGRNQTLTLRKPDFAETFQKLGFFLPGLFASLSICSFNEFDRATGYHAWLLGLMAAGILLQFVLFRSRKDDQQSFDLWAYLMISSLLIMIPFAVLGFTSALLAAVLFILYWIYMAWLGARIHNSHLTDWAIRLVILRLFILYLEVFGNLMNKGFGMILSGVLLILLIRYSPRLIVWGRKMVRYEI